MDEGKRRGSSDKRAMKPSLDIGIWSVVTEKVYVCGMQRLSPKGFRGMDT